MLLLGFPANADMTGSFTELVSSLLASLVKSILHMYAELASKDSADSSTQGSAFEELGE